MALNLMTAPATTAIALSDAKAHCRIEFDDDDLRVTRIIEAATGWVENYTGRSLINRTYQMGMNAFPAIIALEHPPLVSVNQITYTDTDGAGQTLDGNDWTVQPWGDPALIFPSYGKTWPSVRDEPNSVIVEYEAGYGAAQTDIPAPIQQAILLMVGHYYENREQMVVGTVTAEIKSGVQSLLGPYRIYQM